MAGGQLQDHVAAPRLAGDDGPLDAQAVDDAPRSSATVAKSYGPAGLDERPCPRRSTANTGCPAAASAVATPSQSRALDARPWTSTNGGEPVPDGRSRWPPLPSHPRHSSTARSTSSATVTCRCAIASAAVGSGQPVSTRPARIRATTWTPRAPSPSRPVAMRGSRSSTARSAGPPSSRTASVGHATSAPGASGTTNRPGIRTTCESPREIDRTSISVPSASTVSAAQAMAAASGPERPVMTVPPRRSVYSWVTHRGYTHAGILRGCAPPSSCSAPDSVAWSSRPVSSPSWVTPWTSPSSTAPTPSCSASRSWT